MKNLTRLVLFVLLSLFALPAFAQPPLRITSVTADIPHFEGQVLILFNDAIPATLEQELTDPSNYQALVRHSEADELRELAIGKPFVDQTPGTARTALVVPVSGDIYGKGVFRIKEIGGVDRVQEEWPLEITRTYVISTVDRAFSVMFQDEVPVARFKWGFSTDLRYTLRNNKPRNVSRDWLSIDGSVPLFRPTDVEDAGGTSADASAKVADYVKASFTRRWYDGRKISSLGVLARTSGRFNALEAVVNYSPIAMLFDEGHGFVGVETELGYRNGEQEWTSLTRKAPDRGNVVARAGAVLEYAPRLGPINRDLGKGLRFYVRGRGWIDYFENESGNTDQRFRGFLDTEFFYNVSDDYRVFARYEYGYLPPDLNRRVSGFFVGVGSAF